MKQKLTAILACAMLCLTACGDKSSTESSIAETSREESSKAVTEYKEESSAVYTTTLPVLDPHEGAAVVKVQAGGAFSGALTENGNLYLWGANGRGQCGDGTGERITAPKKIMEHVKDFTLTKNGSNGGAITENDDLWCWGFNCEYQVGNHSHTDVLAPVKVLSNVISFDCNDFRSAAVTADGALYVWGQAKITGDNKHLFFNTFIPAEPTKIIDENCKAVCLGDDHMAVLNSSGTLYLWGENVCGEVGNGNREFVATPVKIMEHVKSVSLGHEKTAVITENNELWVWGDNSQHYMVADESAPELITEPYKLMDHVVSVGVNREVCSAVTEDGQLWMWGSNKYAMLGDKTKIDKKVPFKLADGIKQTCVAEENIAICSNDGSFYIWGKNEMNQIDGSDTEFFYTPKLIPIPDEKPETPTEPETTAEAAAETTAETGATTTETEAQTTTESPAETTEAEATTTAAE